MFGKIFRRKSREPGLSPKDARFNLIVCIVKDLKDKEYNELKEVMDVIYQAVTQNSKLNIGEDKIREAEDYLEMEKGK